jgi:beta-galactosidase
MLIRHHLLKLTAALLLLLGFAFGATSQASAATQYYSITASHTGFALDVEGASTADGARIVQWPFNVFYVPANEQWAFIPVPGAPDTYYIQSGLDGKVLSVNSYAAGAPVIQWTNQGVASQQWYEVKQGGTARKYRNVATGLYLDVSGYSYNAGAPLVQWYQTNGLNQVFNVSYLPF